MNRTLTIIWCFMIVMMSYQTGLATDESIPCDPEPTDMMIDYSESVSCNIDSAGDTDIYRFNGQPGEVVSIFISDFSDPLLHVFN